MIAPTKLPSRDELLAKLRDGRRSATPPERSEKEEREAAERATLREAEMAAIRAAGAPVIATMRIKSDFIAAKRAEVDRLEALARSLLEAHPAPEAAPDPGSIADQVEAEWRDLAHASRQLRPLLTALEQANAREPFFEKFKESLDYRLTEAMTTVATLCAHGRVQALHQRKNASNERPNAKSPFTEHITARLKRNPSATAKEIESDLLNAAHGGGGAKFELSSDGSTILTIDEPRRRLKISGIAKAVTEARKKLSAKK